MSTCNRLDLESLGSWLTMPTQKLLGHWFDCLSNPWFSRGWLVANQNWWIVVARWFENRFKKVCCVWNRPSLPCHGTGSEEIYWFLKEMTPMISKCVLSEWRIKCVLQDKFHIICICHHNILSLQCNCSQCIGISSYTVDQLHYISAKIQLVTH